MAKEDINVNVPTGKVATEAEVNGVRLERNDEGNLGCVCIDCTLFEVVDGKKVKIDDKPLICESGLDYFSAARTADDIINWAEAKVTDEWGV